MGQSLERTQTSVMTKGASLWDPKRKRDSGSMCLQGSLPVLLSWQCGGKGRQEKGGQTSNKEDGKGQWAGLVLNVKTKWTGVG